MPKSNRAVLHKPAPASASGQAPIVTRITRDLELVAPHGCRASVLMKLVERDDEHRQYEWWLVVGRHGAETMSVKYKADGADVIRIDVPEGMPLTATDLQPHLAEFLTKERVQQNAPPTIRD
jgi:hypothetical protein